MTFEVQRIREQFPALSQLDGNRRRIYLDNPGGTQVTREVVDRMSRYLLESNANLGGYFPTSRATGDVVDEARDAMADFLNSPSPEEIVFGPNMTSLTLHVSRALGRSFRPGDEIVLSRMDHEGNVSPWLGLAREHGLEVRWLPFDTDTFELDLDRLPDLLGDRTRLVCVGAASNLLGTINDITTISRMAREAGAWTYVDAVQAAPHVPLDVQSIGCDFLVCSAYKFFGPHQGILWGRREVLEQLEPDRVRPAPQSIPGCFETGTQSHEAMAGTTAAVDYFAWVGRTMADTGSAGEGPRGERAGWIRAGLELIFEYETTLSRTLISGLQRLPDLRVLGITDPQAMHRRVPTVSFVVPGHPPASIAEALAERNVFVWSGHNYALEPARALGLPDNEGAVRVGPVHYNTEAEIEEFLGALGEILAG